MAAATRYVVTGEPQTSRPSASLDAGQSSRRLKNWNPSSAELNTLMQGSGSTIVRRARKLVQENCYASNAAEAWTSNLVGTGIRPSCTMEDADEKKMVQDLWAVWVTEADTTGATDFYGLQLQVAHALFDAGEAFVRRRPRLLRDGLSVPLQLQVLEADHVDRTYTMPLPNGHQIRSGIEFDQIGRRTAYWMWRNHPGDATLMSGNVRVRVPAQDVLHVFHAKRPGQIRGFPRIVPAMIPMHELDDYDDAELARKKTTAMLAAFVTSPEVEDAADDGNQIGEGDVDDAGVATAEWEPATVMVLGDGQEVTIAQPSDVGGNYEAFQMRNLLRVASGVGLPYSQVTSDVSKANYSNERAAQVQLRRRMTPLQLTIIVHQIVRPVWRWFIADAVLAGALEGDVQELQRSVKFILPKWEYVDPLKDRKAEQIAVQELWTSRSDVIESEGKDPLELDQRIAADQEREDRLGLRRGTAGATTVPEPDEDQDEPKDLEDDNEDQDSPQREMA